MRKELTMKYLTKQLLKDFNDESITVGRNRNIKEGYIDSLKDDMVYPVTFTMPHNNDEFRLIIMSPKDPKNFKWTKSSTKQDFVQLYLDVSPDNYDKIKETDPWQQST